MAHDPALALSIQRRRLNVVYHFTPLPKLPNLFRRGGLWCRRQLREWGDDFKDDPRRWGNARKAEAFKEYISCSVNPPMGMLSKREQPVLLALDTSVLLADGVVFIGKWSSYNTVHPVEALNQLGCEWFDRMFLNFVTNRAASADHPGEFLVPTYVPLSAVKRFIFYSESDQVEARRLLAGVALPTGIGPPLMVVQPWVFGRKMQEEEE